MSKNDNMNHFVKITGKDGKEALLNKFYIVSVIDKGKERVLTVKTPTSEVGVEFYYLNTSLEDIEKLLSQ